MVYLFICQLLPLSSTFVPSTVKLTSIVSLEMSVHILNKYGVESEEYLVSGLPSLYYFTFVKMFFLSSRNNKCAKPRARAHTHIHTQWKPEAKNPHRVYPPYIISHLLKCFFFPLEIPNAPSHARARAHTHTHTHTQWKPEAKNPHRKQQPRREPRRLRTY